MFNDAETVNSCSWNDEMVISALRPEGSRECHTIYFVVFPFFFSPRWQNWVLKWSNVWKNSPQKLLHVVFTDFCWLADEITEFLKSHMYSEPCRMYFDSGITNSRAWFFARYKATFFSTVCIHILSRNGSLYPSVSCVLKSTLSTLSALWVRWMLSRQ